MAVPNLESVGVFRRRLSVLAIGNSFSQDATRYLHGIAACDMTDMPVVNLYIGGCPISLHAANIRADNRHYSMEFNGQATGFFASIREALSSRPWDVVTIQQVSHKAPDYVTYQPDLSFVCDTVRSLCPSARLCIHETWAYEAGSDRLTRELGYARPADMTRDIRAAYRAAYEAVRADGYIPSGTLFQLMADDGIGGIHRDTFHASFGLGRYALGLLWYRVLTGRPVADNGYGLFDEPVDAPTRSRIAELVEAAAQSVASLNPATSEEA